MTLEGTLDAPVTPIRSGEGWLGRQDSNLRMPVPKTGALPLGDAPAGVPAVREKRGLYRPTPRLEGAMGCLPRLRYRVAMAERAIRDFHAHIYYDPEEVEQA